jgi:hypothetical protein
MCHKYNNEGHCRFLFPHEIVEHSYFDSPMNSVTLKCLDGTVNYFNPYVLVFCRHNHDIKCILSGKGAKAAMFYISDYITKMDVKTYEVLSLLLRAVAHVPDPTPVGSTDVENVKTLLHKCLSQFRRQQQIHAQQAACYIQGFDDSISSHRTIPMLSSVLLAYVRTGLMSAENEEQDEPDSEDDDAPEQAHLRIATDHAGNLVEGNQVHNYVFRAELLADMKFYDFC